MQEQSYWEAQSKAKYGYEDFIRKPQNLFLAETVERIAKGYEKASILEAGCGWGYYIKYFSQIADVAGVDNEEGMIATSRQIVGDKDNVLLKLGDVRKLDFEDNSFDIVCSFGVIEHFDESVDALKEMKRVMKKDGYLVVSVPAAYDLNNRLMRQIAIKRKKILPYMQKHYTIRGFRKMLVQAGLEIETMSGYGYGVLFPQKIKPLEFMLSPLRKVYCKVYESTQKNGSWITPYSSHMLIAVCRSDKP